MGLDQYEVRWWQLKAEMLGEYYLTLPPDAYPLDDGRRADHVRWRWEALAEARRNCARQNGNDCSGGCSRWGCGAGSRRFSDGRSGMSFHGRIDPMQPEAYP